MKRVATLLFVVLLIGAALAGGYWWGTHKAEKQAATPAQEAQAATGAPAKGETKGKILYYRHPMGLPDTSPVPKKDAMGMDYVPVYDGEEPAPTGPGVKISLDKVQKLGVKTEAATLRQLTRTVRAVGTVQLDERQVYTVAPKFEGWIERLLVNTTGEQVKRGQPLMEVYSPDLITAQQEYIIAVKGMKSVQGASDDAQANMQQLVAGALERLRNWDISDQEVMRLEREGTVRRNITLRSPVSGVVVEKPVLKGMRFMPGEMLYQISDLSSVWLLAEVFEQDLALVQSGQAANITVNAYPGRVFKGKVAFIYPTVTPETRTAKVRVVMSNPGGLLKPAMYASVELVSGASAKKVVAVPDSALLDSGTRQIVLVQRGEGLFEPRPVKVGKSADGYVEILDGIKAGEQVVTSANFLIDSESNLKAALGTFGTSTSPADTAGAPAAAPAGTHQGKGTVRGMDLNTGSIKLEHEAIASLKWPGMTMDFDVADKALLKGVKPGDQVTFELAPRAPGEFVITKIAPAGNARSASGPAAEHKGH